MTLDLYIDTERRELVAGPKDSTIKSLPILSQGNTVTLQIRALAPTANFPLGNPPYRQISPLGKSLQVAIGTKAGNSTTIYTSQYVWSVGTDAADPFWYADLPMNTAAITTLLGSSSSKTAWLEVNMVEGNPLTILSKQVTIEASVIKADSSIVPPGLTPMTVEAAQAVFLQREIQGPITLKSVDGTKSVSVYVDADGAFHADPIA